MVKTLLALGDVHVGNEGAIMTEEVNSEECNPGRNQRYFPNLTQKKILKRWYEMCDEVQRPDVLLLNGDLVDGKNYKESGMGTWTTDVTLQATVLADLVKLIKPRKIIATSGSPYHSDRNPNMDRISVGMCGGTFQGGYASLDISGKRIYAQHKVSVSKSSWQYRCYSEDTEVFTENGWKKHADVTESERIAVYDTKSKELFFEIPKNKYIYPHNGKMIEFSNKAGSNILVTPNHKMLIRNHNGEYVFREANDLLHSRKQIGTLITAPFRDEYTCEPNIVLPASTKDYNGHTPISEKTKIPTDTWFEFLGYFLSEGGRQNDPSNSNHQVTFAQKDDAYAEKMETCFKKIGLHFSKTNSDLHRWVFNRKQLWEELAQFGSYAPQKHIPRSYLKYPQSCLKQLADGMLLGDGSIDARDGHYDNYYTTSPQLAADFQELVTLLGIPARVKLHYIKRKPNHNDSYRVYMKKCHSATVSPKEIDYNGNVVCFETSTGAYMTRRPGCYPTIQGNSTPLGRALVLAALNEKEMGHYDVVLKSHAHYYCYCGFSNSLGMILPAWKAFDAFGDTNIEFANPALGYVRFDFDGNDYTFAHSIFHFKGEEIHPDVVI